MKHICKHFLAFLIVLSFTACEKEEAIKKESPYVGYWKLESLTSNVPIDLNEDGIAERDFKNELYYFFEIDSRMIGQDLNIEIWESFSINNRLNLTTWHMPVDAFRPFPYDNPIMIRWKGDYTWKTLDFENDQLIRFEQENPWNEPDSPGARQAWPKYTSYNFIDDNNLEILIDQKFYDVSIDEWTAVKMVAIFSKITDPNYLSSY